MITIAIGNVFCKVDATQEELGIISEYLKYEIKNSYGLMKMLKRKHRGNNKKVFGELNKLKWKTMLDAESNTFHTGLLERVLEGLQKANTPYELLDARQAPIKEFEKPYLNKFDPDWYQTALPEFVFKHPRCIAEISMGGGKSLSMAILIRSFKIPTLVVVDAKQLLYQNRDEFKEIEDEFKIGLIGDGKFDPQFVTIATVQTLNKLIKNDAEKATELLSDFQMLLIDEAQECGSNSFQAVSRCCKNAYYRVGFSGTIFTKDDESNKKVEGMFSKTCMTVTADDINEIGRNAKPYVTFIPIREDDKLDDRLMETVKDRDDKKPEWNSVYEFGVAGNSVRNAKILEIVIDLVKNGGNVLVSCVRVEHANNLAKVLTNFIKADVLHGSHTIKERQKVIDSFEDGKINCIVASTIFDKGVSINNINYIVNAGGGKSEDKTFQKIGRGTRKKGNTDVQTFLFIDFLDYFHDKLLEHSMERYKMMRDKDGYTVVKSIKEYQKLVDEMQEKM